jgi:hypothetical protein
MLKRDAIAQHGVCVLGVHAGPRRQELPAHLVRCISFGRIIGVSSRLSEKRPLEEEQPMPTLVSGLTLEQVVMDFDPESGEAEILRFRSMSSKEAIERAAESKDENGQPYGHQRRNWNFWPEAIQAAMAILTEAEPRFRRCADFDAIHDLVRELLEDARPATDGLGWLYFYDVAFRIAACRGERFMPQKVYLHAGTLIGAKRVLPNRRLKEGDLLEMSELPDELQVFEAWAVENFFCYYNKQCKKR